MAKYYIAYKELNDQASEFQSAQGELNDFENRLNSIADSIDGRDDSMAALKQQLKDRSRTIPAIVNRVSAIAASVAEISETYKNAEKKCYQDFGGSENSNKSSSTSPKNVAGGAAGAALGLSNLLKSNNHLNKNEKAPSPKPLAYVHPAKTTQTKIDSNSKVNDSKPKGTNKKVPQFAGEDNLGLLSGVHESGGNPGTVSSGRGDAGGKSYGAFQFASKFKTEINFMNWLKDKNPSMYKKLSAGYTADGHTNGAKFDAAWKQIGIQNRDEFLKLQYDFTKANYYDSNALAIKNATGFDFNSRGFALKNVLWSRAVQHGSSVVNVVERALSHVNLKTATDEQIIKAIYAESGAVTSKGKTSMTYENFFKANPKTAQANTNYAKAHGIYGKYMKYYSGNSAEVQLGVWKRLNVEEPKEAINMLNKYN